MADNNPIKYSDLISPDDSITKLIAQLKELQETYAKSIANIKAEAEELRNSLKGVSGATEEGRRKTQQAATEADRLAKAQRDLQFAQSETAKELQRLNQAKAEANKLNKLTVRLNSSAEGSYNALAAQYALNKVRINGMTQEERDAAEATEGLISKTRELYERMKEMNEETGQYQLNVGNYENAIKEAVGINGELGDSLLALGRGGDDAKKAFTAMSDGAKALGKTLLGLLKNPVFLGIAGVAAVGSTFKFWYDYNAGLVEATRLTNQFTGKSGEDLKQYRNNVQALADSYGVDFQEVLVATNALAKQFGVTFEDALKLMQDGFVSGANANGEFLDSVKEYPAYLKEAGVTAEGFIAILAQTNKAGIFSDKGIDTIKEGNLRLREMTTSTAAALEGIGISAEQVQKDLQSGSKTTFDVMQEISARLNELPDSASAVGTAIADIFGGPGEDAGLQYLRTLKDISVNIDEVKGKSGELGKLQEEQLKSQMELQNALSSLFDLTGGSFEDMKTSVKVFINGALVSLIKGFISLINYFAEFYNNSLIFRALWNNIVFNLKNAFDVIGNAFKYLGDVVTSFGHILKGAFTLDWGEFKSGVARFANALPNLFKNIKADISQNFKESLTAINGKINPIKIPTEVISGSSPSAQQRVTATPKARQTSAPKSTQKSVGSKVENVEAAYKRNLEIKRKYEDELLKLETDSWKARTKKTEYNYTRQIEDLRHQLTTEKGLTANERTSINQTISALEKQQTEELLKIENERQIYLLEARKKGIELQLQAVEEGSEAERQLKLKQIETDKELALLQNAQQPREQQQSTEVIEQVYVKQMQSVNDAYLQQQLETFDKEQALKQSEFELLKATEGEKTRFRLKAERDRLKKVLEINKQASKQLSDVEVQTMQNSIERLNSEIEASEKDERTQDIYGLFGLKLNDEQKEAIDTSISYAVGALNTFMQAKVDAANKAVEASNKEVERAQTALDIEKTAAANGYAADVKNAQKRLDLAKKNQDKALKEQQKAQRQQQAINAVEQAGNMVAASALIWRQLGFPWAIPAIAVMWASFAASKIKAAQIAKSAATESYGDGTVELLEGGSHQSGRDIDLGTKPDGTKRRAEGGEFFAVINKRNSRRFRKVIPSVINSLNDGTFAAKYMGAYDGANSLKVSIQDKGNSEMRELNDNVREIRDLNRRRAYMDAHGNIVEEYKNLKRVYK